jgi:ABC-type transport system involved in cytochrome c biogenesis permease subunit
MTAVEQGIIGLIIFMGLIVMVLLYGERLYHTLPKGPYKELLMAALVSFCCILFILTLNDMVETDKVGSFFFFCIAIVIVVAIQTKNVGFQKFISTPHSTPANEDINQ